LASEVIGLILVRTGFCKGECIGAFSGEALSFMPEVVSLVPVCLEYLDFCRLAYPRLRPDLIQSFTSV